jgi:predicted nucleic acid-binding protein
VLVFDTFEDSEFHKEASSGLDSLEGWSLPSMVFHELVWFFKSQGIEIRRTIKKVDEYLTNQKANFVPTTADDVRFATSRMKSNGDYNDLVILSAARRLDLPLFSFDHDLREIAERNSVKTLRRVGANPST